jgi:hypothetical protein
VNVIDPLHVELQNEWVDDLLRSSTVRRPIRRWLSGATGRTWADVGHGITDHREPLRPEITSQERQRRESAGGV